MRIRRATEADLPVLERFWRAFLAEIPEPAHIVVDPVAEVAEIAETVRDETALVAEDDAGEVLGYALARRHEGRVGAADGSLRRPAGSPARGGGGARPRGRGRVPRRRRGVPPARGVPSNAPARSVYARWGFRETSSSSWRRSTTLARTSRRARRRHVVRLDPRPDRRRRSGRSAVRQFVPRLPGRSRGSIVVAAAERLGHGLRRRLRPRPGDAAAARPRALRPDGRGRARARGRAGAGRPA